MNKAKIQEALDIIEEELWRTTTEEETDMAVYQVYCAASSFIAEEIKRIMKEEGTVTGKHPEIAPLYKLFDAIKIPMKKYSKTVGEHLKDEE